MAKAEQMDALEKGEPGVGIVRDRKLNALADSFTEKRDAKAKLAEEMTAIEQKILDRMDELKIRVFKYADRVVTLTDGKRHVRIKIVEVGDGEPGEPEE